MKAIVTRPAKDALVWVEKFKSRGLEAISIPLIEIAPPAAQFEAALSDARSRVATGKFAAVMFVSGNAVEGFCADGFSGSQWPTTTRAWAPGPGTATALIDAGVPNSRIDTPPPDGQFDSESLWRMVESAVCAWDRSGAPPKALIVRGATTRSTDDSANLEGSGRNWLADKLTGKGVEVEFAVSYERKIPEWSELQRATMRQSLSGDPVWLFSSSEAIENLAGIKSGNDDAVIDWSRANAIATHPRIADAARRLGFGVVCQSRPTVDDVLASIESLR